MRLLRHASGSCWQLGVPSTFTLVSRCLRTHLSFTPHCSKNICCTAANPCLTATLVVAPRGAIT